MNKKKWALVEVALVTTGVMLLAHWLPALVAKTFGGMWLGNATIGLIWIVPVLLLIKLKGQSLADYGLDLHINWRLAVHVGLWATLLRMVLEPPGFMLWKKLGNPGFILLLMLVSAEIILILWVFRRNRPAYRLDWKLVLLVALAVMPLLWAAMAHKPFARIAGMNLHFLVWVGLGEEVLNRGYILSRLNQVWERKWCIWGTSFGPGLLWSGLFFGLPHIYQIGSDHLNPQMAIGACLGGLVFGVLRERTGTILSGAICHGIVAAAQVYMMK